MAIRLLERAWTWVHTTFPERQLYLRSDSGVQFFTLSSTLQVTCAGLALIFLGWVGFASVNVIFKDRIIAAKDDRYQQMRFSYESRLADLQLSYDQINDALVAAEDTFRATAGQIEAKQRVVLHLLDRKARLNQELAQLTSKKPLPQGTRSTFGSPISAASLSPAVSRPATSGDGAVLNALPEPPAPAPRTAKPVEGSVFGGLFGLVHHVLAALFAPAVKSANPARKLPAFRVLAAQIRRLQGLDGHETAALITADREAKANITKLDAVLRRLGLKPAALMNQEAARGIGGPEFAVASVRIDGISDPHFTTAYVQAAAHVGELGDLFAAVAHVPLTTPVHGPKFDLSSGFGPRIDPFTHRMGFHPGLDFAGPWGAPIHATAPGTVVWAGPYGGYGNMVEINDGFAIRTRYGHMSSIHVHVGERVKRGTFIGRIGSTGRSTGPHVHYEVWVGHEVVNPSRFIAAGQHVLD